MILLRVGRAMLYLLRRQHGRTLIEILVSLSIASLVITMVTSAQANALRWLRVDQERLRIYQPVRDGADMLARDVRISNGMPTASSCSSITIPIKESTTVYTITYTYNAATGELTRNKNGSLAVVARNLTSFCATTVGNEVHIAMEVRKVHITTAKKVPDSVQQINLVLYPQKLRG